MYSATDGLQERGIGAAAYHGGMKAKERTSVQNGFMDGAFEVISATNAFGMGVDKEDVRFVYHHDVPDSVDSYYQEIGRAGRDGAPAEAVLFYRPQDLGLRRFFAGGKGSDPDAARAVVRVLRDRGPCISPTSSSKRSSRRWWTACGAPGPWSCRRRAR